MTLARLLQRKTSESAAIDITDSVIDEAVAFGSTTAGYILSNTKDIYAYRNGVSTSIGTWTTGAPADYEARATLISGTITTGTLGAWLSCSTSPGWFVAVASGDSLSGTILVEVRAASGTVLDSATIEINAVSYGGF